MPGPLAALAPAAALVSREFAKRALKKKLAEAATKGTAAAAVGAGAGVAGEALVNKPKKETEAKTETKPKREESKMGSSKNINVGTGRGASTPQKGTGAYTPKTTPKAPKSDTSSAPTASGRSRENTSPGGGSSANIDTERYTPAKEQSSMGSSENVDVDRIGKGGFEADESYTPVPKNQPVKFEDESSKPFYDRFKKGGMVRKKSSDSAKKYVSGGSVGSASRRGDGCAVRGKTRGRMV